MVLVEAAACAALHKDGHSSLFNAVQLNDTKASKMAPKLQKTHFYLDNLT